jgi:RNA polymerase sigma-70 factor, ECF subfamily
MRTAPSTQTSAAFHPALIGPALLALNGSSDLADLGELDVVEAAEPVAVSWTEMVSHRTALIRFAQRKLHDPMLAEDVVHDVFEAVISGRAKFGGRCALKSWLTAILKFKIVDLVRQRLQLVLDRINALPDSLRSVIELRVLQDRSTEDVCRTLDISEDNLFVRLHRARKQLVS